MSADDRRLPEMRAGDADRERVLEIVRQSHAEGRLSTPEFYDRLEAVYQAKTYAELDRVTFDLPDEPERPAARPSLPAVPASRPAAASLPIPRTGAGGLLREMPANLRNMWILWATVVSINVLIWLIVSVVELVDEGELETDFWPIWVAGPWGFVLAGITATWWFNRGSGPSPQLPPGR